MKKEIFILDVKLFISDVYCFASGVLIFLRMNKLARKLIAYGQKRNDKIRVRIRKL
jgi:hypothetical protein